MIKKLIAISIFSLLAVAFLISDTHASEVTGTLSSSGVSTVTTGTGGSISGTVVGGTTGTAGGGGSSGGGSGRSGARSGVGGLALGPQVLGATTEDPTLYPGLPATGKAENAAGAGKYSFAAAIISLLIISPVGFMLSRKVK